MKDEDKIPADLRQKYIDNILDYVLYDAENCETLSHFEPVKTNTHCTFARMSKLWGALKYNPALSVEANVERYLTLHLYITHVCLDTVRVELAYQYT